MAVSPISLRLCVIQIKLKYHHTHTRLPGTDSRAMGPCPVKPNPGLHTVILRPDLLRLTSVDKGLLLSAAPEVWRLDCVSGSEATNLGCQYHRSWSLSCVTKLQVPVLLFLVSGPWDFQGIV